MFIRLRSFLFISACLVCSSCTVLVSLYVRNDSGNSTSIMLIKRRQVAADNFSFRSAASVRNIEYDSFEHFTREIKSIAVGEKLTITIPANTIVYLGRDAVFGDTFEKLIIPNAISYDTILSDNLRRHKLLQHSGQSQTKFAAWFDLK